MYQASRISQSNNETGSTLARPAQHKTLRWATLPEDVFKSNPRLALLDVGAGSGSMSASFTQIIGPEGHVTAVDVNPIVIPRAKIVAEKWGVTNISFQTADAYKLPFEDGTFDIVHCHQLNISRYSTIRRPREDLETEVVRPPLPGMVKFHYDLEVKLITGRGGCATAGAKRSQVTTSFGTWTYTEPKDRKLWASGMIVIALGPMIREINMKAGITEAAMDEMRKAWAEWMDRDDAVLEQLHGGIIIR
ncbi:S-adenosyl-L-methionine-dependent methyltransferase [Hypoxylon fuscum]|nr:S-adenosyl-L-methionine-dependent methyltransferase [Hypoxylon fuscum]